MIRVNQNRNFDDKDLKILDPDRQKCLQYDYSSEEILFDAIFDGAKKEYRG